MGLFNNSSNGGSLTPNGIGGGPTDAQKQLFANAAQESGLAAMGMGMVDQMTGGQSMQNEDQVKLLYQLMAAHPNQVSLLSFLAILIPSELMNTIALVVKKEVFALLNSDIFPGIKAQTDSANFAAYNSITQENIDAQLAKVVVPAQQLQMEVQQNDMQAIQLMNGHNQHMAMQNQQQMMQQQMYQQQMMQQQMPQRQGLEAHLQASVLL